MPKDNIFFVNFSKTTRGFFGLTSYTPCKAVKEGTLKRCQFLQTIGGVLFIWLSLFATHAKAADEIVYKFNISTQPLVKSLNELSNQTESLILFPYDLVENRNANTVSGHFTIAEALDEMLMNTGLVGGRSKKGVLMISKGKSETARKNIAEKSMQKKKTLFSALISLLVSGTATETIVAQSDTRIHGLEEIVVTAQKRSESVNDVGLTISAFAGSDLSDKGINNVEDLAKIVPGLTFARSAYSTPVYTLRGVGFFDTALAASPAVSVYVDEAPLSFPILTSYAGALDIERVEVLKGPQGILFGQNSTGGAINYIANKPTDEFEAGVEIGLSRFETVEAEAYISGSLSENVKSRLAVKTVNSGPWQQNYFSRPGDEHGERDEFVVRWLMEWNPSDSLVINTNLSGFVDESEPSVGQYIAFPQLVDTPFLGPGGAEVVDLFNSIPFAPADARAADWSEQHSPQKDETMIQFSVRADYSFGNDMTLTSITSYTDFDRNSVSGDDGVFFSANNLYETNGDLQDFFQEIRLANDPSSGIRYVVGANYNDSEVFELNANEFLGTAFYSTLPLNGIGFSRAEDWSNQEIKTFGMFGNVEFDVSDDLTLRAGLRYTDTERDFVGCTGDPNDDPFVFPGAFSVWKELLVDVVYGVQTDLGPGECLLFLVDTDEVGPYEEVLSEDNISWKLGVDYKPSDETLYYANITQGYKAGSGPNVSSSISEQYRLVTEESVLAFEAGIKKEMLDRTMLFTGALFRYDYDDKQLKTGFIDQVFGTLFKLDNVPGSQIQGAEATLSWAASNRLNLTASATYLDSEVTEIGADFINGIGEPISVGDALPYTPELGANLNIDYSAPISNNLYLNLGASVTYSDDTQATLGSDPVTMVDQFIKSYTTVDARVSVGDAEETWKVQLWAKNLTDQYYWNNVVQVGDTTIRYAAQPRTFGIVGSYNF